MKQTLNRKHIILAGIALLVTMVVMAVIYFSFTKHGDSYSKSITVEITYPDLNSEELVLRTDAEYLRGALEEANLIEGEESEYGLYVTKVGGVLADYETNGAYWGFSKDGEYLMTGIDTTVIEDGDHYEIAYIMNK